MRALISETSNVATHCARFGLSNPKDEKHAAKCDHEHNETCDECELVETVIQQFRQIINRIVDREERERAKHYFEMTANAVLEWRSHLIRSFQQRGAKASGLDSLDDKTGIIIMQ